MAEVFFPRPDQVRAVAPLGSGEVSLLATFVNGDMRVEVEVRDLAPETTPWRAVDAAFRDRVVALIRSTPELNKRRAANSLDAAIEGLRNAADLAGRSESKPVA